jgi:hypothetical protein
MDLVEAGWASWLGCSSRLTGNPFTFCTSTYSACDRDSKVQHNSIIARTPYLLRHILQLSLERNQGTKEPPVPYQKLTNPPFQISRELITHRNQESDTCQQYHIKSALQLFSPTPTFLMICRCTVCKLSGLVCELLSGPLRF